MDRFVGHCLLILAILCGLLYEHKADSDRDSPHSRRKRYVVFPEGSSFSVSIKRHVQHSSIQTFRIQGNPGDVGILRKDKMCTRRIYFKTHTHARTRAYTHIHTHTQSIIFFLFIRQIVTLYLFFHFISNTRDLLKRNCLLYKSFVIFKKGNGI